MKPLPTRSDSTACIGYKTATGVRCKEDGVSVPGSSLPCVDTRGLQGMTQAQALCQERCVVLSKLFEALEFGKFFKFFEASHHTQEAVICFFPRGAALRKFAWRVCGKPTRS